MSTHGSDTFEERLLKHLTEYQARDGSIQTGKSITPRRRGRLVGVSTVACVAVVTIIVVAAAHLGTGSVSPSRASRQSPNGNAVSAPPSRVRLASPLRVRLVAAMSDAVAHDAFLSVEVLATGTVLEGWVEPSSTSWRFLILDTRGNPVHDSAARTTSSGLEGLLIDYGAKTWSYRFTPASQLSHPVKLADAATALKDWIASATNITDLGTDVVNGVSAIHIRAVGPDGGSIDLWIDPNTSLPVKQVAPTGVTTYSWLSSSAAAANLWPTPPAGFTQIAPPTADLPPATGN